jgi:flagellar basal body L-ring protein FlgH
MSDDVITVTITMNERCKEPNMNERWKETNMNERWKETNNKVTQGRKENSKYYE